MQHVARTPRQAAQRVPAPKPPKATSTAGYDPLAEYLSGKYDSPSQLQALASNITKENDEAVLAPLRQQSKEITGAEGTALTRFGQMGAAGQQVQAGLQQGEEASAKTAENQAAENALSASKAIEGTGQSAADQTAGYVDPQVQAALTSAQTQTAGVGGAAAQFQQAMGVSGANEMSALRAAAAQRVVEGAQRIGEGYAASQAKGANEEDKVLAKRPAETKSLAVELGNKQASEVGVLKEVGVKEGTLSNAKEKVAVEKAYKEGETKKGFEEAGTKKAKLGIEREKNAATREKTQSQLKSDEVKNGNTIRTAEIKAKSALEVANKKDGHLTTSEEDKAVGELSSAYATIQQLRTEKVSNTEIREGLTKGSLPVKSEGKVTKEKIPTIKNQVLVQAAMELWDFHKVNSVTERQLTRSGIQVPQEWVNGSFKGF